MEGGIIIPLDWSAPPIKEITEALPLEAFPMIGFLAVWLPAAAMELRDGAGAEDPLEDDGKEDPKAPKLKGSDDTAGAGAEGAGAGAGVELPNAPKANGSSKPADGAGAGAAKGVDAVLPKASKLGAAGAGAGGAGAGA